MDREPGGPRSTGVLFCGTDRAEHKDRVSFNKHNKKTPKLKVHKTLVLKRLPTMQETQVRSLGWDDPLEKEMAPHSSILAGESHGQRSLVGYSPWGSQRVGHTQKKESDTIEQLHFRFPWGFTNRGEGTD